MKTNISLMKFQSDILMNILFILDTIFFKSDTKFFRRQYVSSEALHRRRHYEVKWVGSKGVIMEERVNPIVTSHVEVYCSLDN